MKITVFTSNQPRHIVLIEKLINQGFAVNVVSETATICPGRVQDLYQKSELHASYFEKVMESENYIFGDIRPLKKIDNFLSIRMGDVNFLTKDQLEGYLESDVYIVFGASYIKGWLCDYLVSKRAINIHVGMSPFYRGSSCNFWACFDENYEYVGATLHFLSAGLDSGKIIELAHANAEYLADKFLYSMSAVESGQNSLIKILNAGVSFSGTGIEQQREYEIRYSKKNDFTEQHIFEYLQRGPVALSRGSLEHRIKKVSERFKKWKLEQKILP